MRLSILMFVIFAVITAALVMNGKSPFTPQNTQVANLYQGSGETNLDLSSPDNILLLDLAQGQVVIQMRPDLAPRHVARIKELVRQGFYDGVVFHRVLQGFMAQTGDPLGTGMGGSGIKLAGEFSQQKFVRGVVGMARSQGNDSADSQFFIMLGDGRWLDGEYTVWGQVLDGMDAVSALKLGDRAQNGKIDGTPDKVLRMRIKSDLE